MQMNCFLVAILLFATSGLAKKKMIKKNILRQDLLEDVNREALDVSEKKKKNWPTKEKMTEFATSFLNIRSRNETSGCDSENATLCMYNYYESGCTASPPAECRPFGHCVDESNCPSLQGNCSTQDAISCLSDFYGSGCTSSPTDECLQFVRCVDIAKCDTGLTDCETCSARFFEAGGCDALWSSDEDGLYEAFYKSGDPQVCGPCMEGISELCIAQAMRCAYIQTSGRTSGPSPCQGECLFATFDDATAACDKLENCTAVISNLECDEFNVCFTLGSGPIVLDALWAELPRTTYEKVCERECFGGCVEEFAAAGGCVVQEDTNADPRDFIPHGCWHCGEAAGQYCNAGCQTNEAIGCLDEFYNNSCSSDNLNPACSSDYVICVDSTKCPQGSAERASIIDDPHFRGFDGSKYDFQGLPGSFFNLITDTSYQLNALFTSSPTDGKTYMSELGFMIGHNEIFVNPKRVRINNKTVSKGFSLLKDSKKGVGTVRVDGTQSTIVANGYKVVVTTQKDDGEFVYLNIAASVESHHIQHPHGLLGQTAKYLVDGTEPAPVNVPHQNQNAMGFIEGTPTDYLVNDGIYGTDFLFNRFGLETGDLSHQKQPRRFARGQTLFEH